MASALFGVITRPQCSQTPALRPSCHPFVLQVLQINFQKWQKNGKNLTFVLVTNLEMGDSLCKVIGT